MNRAALCCLLAGCQLVFPFRDPAPDDGSMPSDGTPMPSDGPRGDAAIDCPAGYTGLSGLTSKYKLSLGDAQPFGGNTSGGAALACAGGSESARTTHLVVFDDQNEFDTVRGLSADVSWVGHRRVMSGGPFLPVSNQPTGLFPPVSGSPPWATNEPDALDLCMAVDPVDDGRLAALDCDVMAEYICECDGISPSLDF